MPQSLAQVYVHIVFSTKDRKPQLRDDGLRDQLYAYLATTGWKTTSTRWFG